MTAPVPGSACMALAAGYLPPRLGLALPRVDRVFAAHGRQVTMSVPRADAGHVQAIANGVSAAARRVLADLPVMRIVDAIDRTVTRMLDATEPQRQTADAALPIISGFDPEMVRLGLTASLAGFRRPQLVRWLTEEFGDPALLDEFRPRPRGGWSRAYGATVLGHVWAGNVPALPLWTLVAGLLTKAGSVAKVASDEPWLAGWFARTLAQEAPELAETLAIVWWPGEDAATCRALAQACDTLIVYGGDAAMAAWRDHTPASTRLLAHGHKLSAGLVAAAVLDTRQAQAAARQAALDVARWDQQGCYSPQVFYVESGAQVTPRDFAHLLAGELAAVSHRFERRALSLAESQAMARWRQALARRALNDGDRVQVLGAAHAPWAVAYLDHADHAPDSALNRSICVVAVPRLEDAVAALAPFARVLQTVAVAAPPARLFALAAQLGAIGTTRICALGSAALPEPGWHHDGRFSLLDLVRMVDLEAGALAAAEAYTAHRD